MTASSGGTAPAIAAWPLFGVTAFLAHSIRSLALLGLTEYNRRKDADRTPFGLAFGSVIGSIGSMGFTVLVHDLIKGARRRWIS